MISALSPLRPLPVLRALLVVGAVALGSGSAWAQDKPAVLTPHAVITLAKGGQIALEFFPQDSPRHVENFLALARKGFYDGQRVHRVAPGFVVQGGCPKGTGTGGPGYTIPAEFNQNKHLRGSLAMARSQHPDSAGSQFYITYGAQPHLDNNYTVFGKVTSGMEHVDRIRQGDRMTSITITEE